MTAHRTFLLTILAMSICFATLSVSAQEWGGLYRYNANFGRNAGGFAMNVTYEIGIEDGSDPDAEITADGYQTSNTVLCHSRTKGNSIELRFWSYPDGKMENEYGVKLYKKNDVLLTLTRVVSAGKTKYRAVIGKYNTDVKGPIYFKKVR
jgi:hypothetical protein